MATTAITGANVLSTGSSTQQQQRSASLGSASPKLPLFDTARRVWCQSPLPHYVLEHQRYVQPARCIPLVRPGRDLIVLPGGHEPTRKMWEFNKELLGLSDEQVIWTQGSLYNMDKDMDALTLVDLKRRILKQSAAASAASASTASAAAGDSHSESEQEHWLLVPYAPQAEFERWARPLLESLGDGRASVFGETEAWLRQFGDKGLLHRHMDRLDEPSEIEKVRNTPFKSHFILKAITLPRQARDTHRTTSSRLKGVFCRSIRPSLSRAATSARPPSTSWRRESCSTTRSAASSRSPARPVWGSSSAQPTTSWSRTTFRSVR